MTKTYRLYIESSDSLQESLEDLLKFLHRRAELLRRIAHANQIVIDLMTNEMAPVGPHVVIKANDVCPQHAIIITALL